MAEVEAKEQAERQRDRMWGEICVVRVVHGSEVHGG